MKLPTKLVAVKKISSSVPRSNFVADDVEKAAKLFIEVEGTINPLILRRTSLESYEVIDGHFEYYAAVRARERSPLKGEMIQAIILEDNNNSALLEQVDLIRKGSQPTNVISSNPDNTKGLGEQNFQSMVSNLEKIFTSQFELLRQDLRSLERKIIEIESKKSNADLEDEKIQKIATEIANRVIVSNRSYSSTNKSIDELRENPINLNLASESELCSVPGIGPRKAIQIIERRRDKGIFKEITELAEINGISRNTISSKKWNECFVL